MRRDCTSGSWNIVEDQYWHCILILLTGGKVDLGGNRLTGNSYLYKFKEENIYFSFFTLLEGYAGSWNEA